MAAASEADRAGYAIDGVDPLHVRDWTAPQLNALGADLDGTDREAVRQQCFDYARRHGIKPRPFGKVDARAEALGRLADLGAYKIAHRYVHGSHVTSARVRRLDESGVVLFSSADLDQGVLPIVAVWTTRSALIAFRCLPRSSDSTALVPFVVRSIAVSSCSHRRDSIPSQTLSAVAQREAVTYLVTAW